MPCCRVTSHIYIPVQLIRERAIIQEAKEKATREAEAEAAAEAPDSILSSSALEVALISAPPILGDAESAIAVKMSTCKEYMDPSPSAYALGLRMEVNGCVLPRAQTRESRCIRRIEGRWLRWIRRSSRLGLLSPINYIPFKIK